MTEEHKNDLIGDNNPPEPIDEGYEALIERGNELAGAIERIPKPEADGAEDKLATFSKQCKTYIKDVNSWHKETKEPFRTAGLAVDAKKNGLVAAVAAVQNAAAAALNTIGQAKLAVERKRREDAEALAQKIREDAEAKVFAAAEGGGAVEAAIAAEEAEADIKAADNAAKPQSANAKSSDGASVGFTNFWNFEIVDYNKVPVAVLRKHLGDDAFKKAVRSAIKEGSREIKGVRIFEDTRQTVR